MGYISTWMGDSLSALLDHVSDGFVAGPVDLNPFWPYFG